MKIYKLLTIGVAFTFIACPLSACLVTSPVLQTPTPVMETQEQVVPTWTASPQEPALPTWTASPIPPAASTTPSSTSIPSLTPTLTLTPTPIIPAIASAMLPVVSGKGVPGAAVYNPNEPGPHPVVLLSASGSAYIESRDEKSIGGESYFSLHDWNELLPYDWLPSSTSETELVVIIGAEREFNLGSQAYNRGPNITRYRYETDIELRAARTGQTLATYNFIGSAPLPFPQSARIGLERLEGSRFGYTLFEDWLCLTVAPQGCWEPLHTLEGQAFYAINAVYSRDGLMLASRDGFDGNDNVRLWRTSGGILLHTLVGHTSGVSNMAFSPDGRILASGSYDTTVRLWRVADGSLLGILQGDSDWINSVAFSPDEQTLLSVSSPDGSLTTEQNMTTRLWRISDGTLLRTLEKQDDYTATPVFAPDGQTLAVVADSATVQLWRTSDGALLHTLEGDKKPVTYMVYSPDGQILASGSYDEPTRLWQVSDGSLLRTLEGQENAADSVAFSPDGQTLVSESNYRTLQLWRVSNGVLLQTLKGQTDLAGSTVFSPDGKVLATWESDTVQFWQVSDGALLRTLEGPAGWVKNVAFSPDGQTLASVASSLATLEAGSSEVYTFTVQLWRVSNGTLLRTLWVENGYTPVVTFLPDGQTLAISVQGVTRLWKLR